MRVRRFVATDVQKALAKVKNEMGDEAVILHVRPVREGGFFGFFGKMMTEITAALEEKSSLTAANQQAVVINNILEEPVKPQPPILQLALNQEGTPTYYVKPINSPTQTNPLGQINHVQSEQPIQVGLEQASVTIRQARASCDANEIPLTQTQTVPINPGSEIRELRDAIELMSKQVTEQLGELGAKDKLQGLGKLQHELIAREIEEGLAQRLLLKCVGNQATEEQLHSRLNQELLDVLGKVVPLVPLAKRPLICALVGPTGVGKTTTIAKLAANFCLVENCKVALLTADTYRVAAVDQLKTFAEIIRVPVEVVVSPNSVQEAIERHSDKDIIFLDTAGRSPNNQLQLSELRVLLDRAKPDRVFLTMSATTRGKDMLDIVDKFNLPQIDSLIFTKLDETSTYGGIISVVDKTGKPLAYMTNGQNVPDDIILANPQEMVRQVMGGM